MTTVFDVLVAKFNEDVMSSTQFLTAGGAKTFEEYKEVVGRIRGLQLAIHTTQELARNQMDSDDD